jgi:superoxide reductase
MKGRREFLKGSLALAGAALAGRASEARAAISCQAGLVYTQDAPGRWEGKQGTHAPKITVSGRKVTIVTPHPMTAPHYIVKHSLLKGDGAVLGEKTFANTDPAAESTHELPEGFAGRLLAVSVCNVHDLWVSETAL